MQHLIAALEEWAKQTRGAYVYKNIKASEVLDAFKTLVDANQPSEAVEEHVLNFVSKEEYDRVVAANNAHKQDHNRCNDMIRELQNKYEKLIELNIAREASIQQALNHLLNGEHELAYDVLDRVPRDV